MSDIGINLSARLGELVSDIREALISEIGKSDIVSDTHPNQVIKVNVFDYTELGVVNGKLCFLDKNGYQFDLLSDCTFDDLIDILIKIED